MNDFPDLKNENIGGLKAFSFVPIDLVTFMPDQQNLSYLDIGLKPEARWYRGKVAYKSLNHLDRLVSSPHGDYYSNEVQLFYPGTSAELELLMDEMCNRRFLLRTTDYQGNQRVIGTLNDPLSFTREFRSAEIGGRKGYMMTFSNRQLRQNSFYVDGVVLAGSIHINSDGKLEVLKPVPNHTFVLDANGKLQIIGPYDYKFYMNTTGQVVFDEFRTP